MKLITSLSNPLIKERIKLYDGKTRKVQNKYLIEGYHLVNEAKKIGALEEVFITKEEDKLDGITNYLVSAEVMKKLSKTKASQGIMGLCKIQAAQLSYKDNFLILDSIQDPGNLGTILRTALGFKVANIVLSKDSVDLYNDKVLRSNQGAHFHLNVVSADIKSVLKTLKEKSYTIYASLVKGAKPLNEVVVNSPYALILGNEARGISEDLKSFVDENIIIKMDKRLESFNVGIAGAIILYHFSQGEIHAKV